jgi:flavin-dependent dehydrogenase
VEAGWWYSARLPSDRAVALVASDPDIIKELQLHTKPGWLRSLSATEQIRPALEGATLIRGSLKMRSAPSGITEPSAGDSWLAVGDAAVSFDPLSSQGIYQALAGGLDAGSAIAAWLQGDRTGVASYADGVRSRFDEYLANRTYLYGLERRWETAPFWARRRDRNEPSEGGAASGFA